jgi:serine/threonine-protein kinase
MTEVRRDRIGRYVVQAELGRGAMGVVYRAHDPQLDRHVAIKTVRRDLGLAPEADADLRKRVHQEATAAGRLTHPHIVAIHDVLELNGIPYIVMEYVDGRTLAELIAAEGALVSSQAVRLVTEVCAGLEYAHGHGVVHRDIKPSNILVTAEGVAKVGDFGIARVAGSRVTRTGAILGTPAYMSPEQLQGRVLDGRSDIFALAVTLYEAVTGVPPFQGDDLVALLYQIAHQAPPPLSARHPAAPRALEPVIERAMAKNPEERYATAGAFAHALIHAMAAAEAAPRPKARSRRRRRRGRLVALACLAIAGAGGWAAWARWAPDRPVVAAGTVVQVAEPELPALIASPAPAAAETAPAQDAAPPPVEPDPPPPTVLAGNPPTGVPAAPVKPAEEPAPPPSAERPPPRPIPVPGSIRVVTDPAVEVLLDGRYRGRTKGSPLVVPKVAPGERMVTLRLNSREQTLFASVSSGETATVTYRFPPELPHASAEKALGKLREGVEKAQREAAGALRDILDGDAAKRGGAR